MAPKASQPREPEVTLDEEAQAEIDESNRLQSLCYDHGIVAKARRMDAVKDDLKLPAKLDGKDIVKRGNTRKNRYLLNIPGQLSAMTAGKLGSLAKLETRNPVLYIDFPEGRLKFRGTLFFPKNKYMTLRLAPKEVKCEDIFESLENEGDSAAEASTLIVFSEHCWIGTKEENPDEHALPMPSNLALAPEDNKHVEESQPTLDLTQAQPTQAIQEGASPAEPAVRSSQRRAKRPRYTEASSPSEAGSDEDASQEPDEAPKQKRKTKLSQPGSSGKMKAKGTPAKTIVLSDGSKDESDKPLGSTLHTDDSGASPEVAVLSQRSQPDRRARPKKSLAPIFEDSEEENGGGEEDDSRDSEFD